IREVDSVLPADPAAPPGTGYQFYLAMSGCVLRVAGFAELAEQVADAVCGALVAIDLAFPAAFPGIVGQLSLQAEAFAKTRRVLRGGDELGACEVEVAFA